MSLIIPQMKLPVLKQIQMLSVMMKKRFNKERELSQEGERR